MAIVVSSSTPLPSLTNYNNLQTFVAQWAHRSDLTSVMPDLIKIGESYLNRVIRTRAQDTVTDLTASTSTRELAFPSRMLELCDLALVIDGRQEKLQQVGNESFFSMIREESGRPYAYCVKDKIEFDCIPDSAYTVKCHYFKSLDIATDSTNFLLTNYPDAYLFATMAALQSYTKSDPSYYLGLMDKVVATINTNEARSKSTTLITEFGTSSYNIYRG